LWVWFGRNTSYSAQARQYGFSVQFASTSPLPAGTEEEEGASTPSYIKTFLIKAHREKKSRNNKKYALENKSKILYCNLFS